jgi:hypothetical protein
MTGPLDTIKSAILGIPLDPTKKPSREGVVQAFSEMQSVVDAAQSGALVLNTRAELLALTAVNSAKIMAWVLNDSTAAFNGIYGNDGSALSPAFTRKGPIPQYVVTGINVGAGTANAIVCTTDLPFATEDARNLIIIPILEANTTAAPTVTIGGFGPLTIIANAGGTVPIGGLSANGYIAGWITDSGTKFRLLNDQAVTAIQAACEAAQAAAETAQSNAETAQSLAEAAQAAAEAAAGLAGGDPKLSYAVKSSNYTLLTGDNNKVIECTSALTLSLTAAATLAANWHVWVFANGGDVIIDPDASETIDGASTITIEDGTSAFIICNGTSFVTDKIFAELKLKLNIDGSNIGSGASKLAFLNAIGSLYTGGAQTLTATQAKQVRTNMLGGFGPADAIYEEQYASGTNGGNFTASSWTKRLVSLTYDPLTLIALSANEFTPSVDCYIEFGGVGYSCNQTLTRIYNVTDAVSVAPGLAVTASVGGNGTATSTGQCRLTAGKKYRLEQYCTSTKATNGLGNPVASGEQEKYAFVKFWRI